jgi:hypothetical protein
MPPNLNQAIRSRWFAACVHVGLWVLLYLALMNLGGRAPEVRDAGTGPSTPQFLAPVAGLERLYAEAGWPKPLLGTNASDPFFTRYFVPPAPPPPPTTRKIYVTYQGFYQISDGPMTTIFIKLDDAFQMAPIGARVATNLFLAGATMQALTLTNLTGQTNILPLNAKTELVVPIP